LTSKDIKDNGLEYFGRYYASYKGTVHSNKDPDNLGRLQLKVPDVYGQEVYETWAYPKGLYSGKDIGSFWLPNEGDKVWVSFEKGDVRFPLWEYGWWVKGSVPKDADPDVKVLQTTSGNRIVFDDKDKLIRIKDAHGNIVELNRNGVSVVTDKISLGSLDGSDEPAVLGDKAMDLLNEFIVDLGNVGTITTSTGVTNLLSTSPQWATLVTKWKTKWKYFKSKKVTIDK